MDEKGLLVNMRNLKMRKLISAGAIAVCLLAFTSIPSLAAKSIADVSEGYWAAPEIVSVVNDGVMSLSGNKFNPEDNMTRVEFVTALLKVLSNENLNVNIRNQFSDVTEETPGYANILRSQQLGLVYGYPDGTFQPERVLLRDEAQSVISHITKDMVADKSILKNFSDASSLSLSHGRGPPQSWTAQSLSCFLCQLTEQFVPHAPPWPNH